MKSELQKMLDGELYNFHDPEVTAVFGRSKEIHVRLNSMTRRDPEFPKVLRELIPDMPESSTISVPFYCDVGFQIKVGEHSFINKNCTFLDSGGITIGSYTKIGPNCGFYTPQHPTNYLERRKPIETGMPIKIGDDCWIGPGAVIHDGARIGKRCKIHTAASLSCLPQDLKFVGEKTTAEIGDDNDIREYVTISRGTASRGKTVVGSGILLMAYVHVAHDDVVGNHCVIANRVSLAGEVEVGDWVVIGGHAALHQWIHIGDHAMIQGGALVTQDVPPFIIATNGETHYAGINKVGLSRRGFTQEQIESIHNTCRILFQSELNYMAGCDKAEAEVAESAERNKLIDFVRGSKRGVIKPYQSRR